VGFSVRSEEIKDAYTILVGKLEWTGLLLRRGHTFQDYIKKNIK
jgi:hypothetical protein